MEPARRKEPASVMESARGMEIQRPEAGTTDDDMKPADKMMKSARGMEPARRKEPTSGMESA